MYRTLDYMNSGTEYDADLGGASRPNFEDMEPLTEEDFEEMVQEAYNEDYPIDGHPRFYSLDGGDTPYDPVDKPKHYMTFPDAEAIDLIEMVLTKKEFIGYLKGNYMKYRLRAGDKDNLRQDIEKSKWYQGELFAKYEELDNG